MTDLPETIETLKYHAEAADKIYDQMSPANANGIGLIVRESMGRHRGIDVISFTGSTEVGRLFLEFSAKNNLKKTILKYGGKKPAVVFSDADDLDSIAKHVVYSAVRNMGRS